MPTLSVSVSDNLKQKMNKMDEVNWSAVARKAFEEKINDIEFVKSLAGKSKLTVADARKFSDKIGRSAAKRFLEI